MQQGFSPFFAQDKNCLRLFTTTIWPMESNTIRLKGSQCKRSRAKLTIKSWKEWLSCDKQLSSILTHTHTHTHELLNYFSGNGNLYKHRCTEKKAYLRDWSLNYGFHSINHSLNKIITPRPNCSKPSRSWIRIHLKYTIQDIMIKGKTSYITFIP